MKKNISLAILFFMLLAILAGCAQKAAAAPSAETQAAPQDEAPVASASDQTEAETAENTPKLPEETPTTPVEPFALNEQVYASPSGAFAINLPQNWNCSETGQYRVDCHNADNTGTVIVRAIGTGYELTQDSFLALVQAELVNRYENVKAYTEISRDASEGSVTNLSTWMEGDAAWKGSDRFLRSGPAVYYLTFAGTQDRFDTYQPAFEQIYQNAKFTSSVMSGAPLYAFTREYVSREKIYSLKVPTSWSKFADASLDRTVVEGFTSPDGRAGVQMAVFAKGSHISQETKGVKTLEIMHKLYGWDVRVLTDKALPDGREWLTWYGKQRGIYGSTYFDSYGTFLYFFSVIWEDSTKDLYKPVLDEITASFTYK